MSVSFRDAKKAAGDGMLIDLAQEQKALLIERTLRSVAAPTGSTRIGLG
jgi:hypothetical protein